MNIVGCCCNYAEPQSRDEDWDADSDWDFGQIDVARDHYSADVDVFCYRCYSYHYEVICCWKWTGGCEGCSVDVRGVYGGIDFLVIFSRIAVVAFVKLLNLLMTKGGVWLYTHIYQT